MRIAVGEEHSHLVGSSLGGCLSWYYAATHPEHVDRLILIDPLCYPQRMPLPSSVENHGDPRGGHTTS